MKFIWFCIILICSATSSNLNAQWTKTNGPVGGNVRSIVYSQGEFYAATSGNGIFISKNNGLTWEKTYKTNEMLYILALAAIDSTLFLGSDGQGIYISEDKGVHWTFSSLSRNHVWEFLTSSDTIYAIAESGIYITKDKAKSWNKFNPDQPLVMTNCIQLKGDTLYAGTNQGIYFTSLSGGKWTKISSGLGRDSVVDHLLLKDSFIFAGTQSGLYRSSDNGTIWTKCSNDINENYISALYINGNDILAGSYYGAFISANNGESWEQMPFDNQYVWCFYRKDDNIYAGTYPGGIYVSADNGKTWSQLKLINSFVYSVFCNEKSLIASTGAGIFYSTDSGNSWNKSEGVPSSTFAIDITQVGNILFTSVIPGDIFVPGQVYGVYISTDDGRSWAATSLKSDQVNCISSSGNNLYAGLGNGFYASTDFGKSWTKSVVSSLSTYPDVRSIFPSEAKIYISARDSLNKVFVSEDGGISWKGLGLNLKNTGVNSVVKIGKYLFASSDFQGIFVSTNEGAEWTAANNGLDVPYIKTLLKVDNSLIAVTSYKIYITNDYGNTWSDITGDLDARYSRCITVGGNELFAGTYGDGVWRRPITDLLTDIENKAMKVPVEFSLCQNYPNPFNPTTTISYSLPIDSHVELKVYDMLGHEVSTLVNEQKNAGEYKVQFNASSLPSGVYIYTIKAGEYISSQKVILVK